MKLRSAPLLFSGLCAVLTPSCSWGPGVPMVEGDPAAAQAADKNPGGRDPSSPQGAQELANHQADPATTVDISRLRLPDMENLPDDRELESGKTGAGGGGVIARPPSE